MKSKSLFLLLYLLTLPLLARPITHEDVWTMRRLGSPAVSPDGKWVVLSVTEPAYDKKKQISDLWLLSTDGKVKPRRLTGTSDSEGDACWSPRGDRLLFTAKREKDKSRQLYMMDMTGPGEAQRVTDFPLDCSRPRFTPDGRKVVFQALVWPGHDSDVKGQKKAVKANKDRKEKVSSYEGFPIRYWDHWLDGRHPRPYLLTLGSDGQPIDLLKDSLLVKEPGFAGVPGLSGESLQHTISPDGQELLFVATTNRDEAVSASTHFSLYSVPLAGGTVREVAGAPGSVYNPKFDGRGHLFTEYEEEGTGFVYNPLKLWRQPWPSDSTGSGQSLSEGFDLSVDEYEPSSRGSAFVVARQHGRKRIFELRPSREPRLVTPDSRGVFSGLEVAGDRLICRHESGSEPEELVRLNSSGRLSKLSRFNTDRVAQLDWQPFREFWFKSEKGRDIHSWVVLPPEFSEKKTYPLVLFIHGGPHSSSLDSGHVRWSPQLLAAGGYVVLLTDYTGSVGYGADFARAIQGDPLRTPGKELEQAVEEAARRYPFIDADRVAAGGASYGGHLVNWLQATTERFDCLIGHAGLVDLEGQWSTSDAVYHRELNNGGLPWEGSPIWEDQSPSNYVKSFKTPILLTIGEKDYRVPLNQTLANWTYLQRMNVPSKLLVYHQANHWIMSGPDARHFWSEVHDWLGRHLKP